ncbi:MAG: hypothetical protein NT086_07665 [Proteobacteria bacterium]|nr:hypothetical protein [Pseudomonadota bacterium]
MTTISKIKSFFRKRRDVINSPISHPEMQLSPRALKMTYDVFGQIKLQLKLAGVTNLEDGKKCNAVEVLAYSFGTLQAFQDISNIDFSMEEKSKSANLLSILLFGEEEHGTLMFLIHNEKL